MGKRFSKGFTVIEVTLFVAISGVLIVTLLVGAGASLNTQRYRDSATSFKSLLQKQYSSINNVQNSYSGRYKCNPTAEIVEVTNPADDSDALGQSECVLVGKYLYVNGSDIDIYSLVSLEDTTDTSIDNDLEYIKENYIFRASTAEVESHSLEWGTEIAWAQDGVDEKTNQTPRDIGILIIRSPHSGYIYTFTTDSPQSDGDSLNDNKVKDMMESGDSIPGQAARTICIEPNGLTSNNPMNIYIKAYAASSSAIELRTNDIEGGVSQC